MFFNLRKKHKLNIVITGAKGQLGSYLVDCFRRLSFKKNSMIGNVYGIGKEDLDITDSNAVNEFFDYGNSNPPIKIDYVIHCAAATDTAAIEKDPYGNSYLVNVLGTRNIARACAKNGIKLVHISTDYVFSRSMDTNSGSEWPVNAYGMQKLLAEKEVQIEFAGKHSDWMILRPSWMFGNSNHSFIEKLLSSIARGYAIAKMSCDKDSSKPLYKHNVVVDAIGRPTPTRLVAYFVYRYIDENYYNGSAVGIVDAQPICDKISRFTWATGIVNAFSKAYYEKNESENKALTSIVNEMLDNTVISPCYQSDFQGGMMHPGFLPVDEKSQGIRRFDVLDSKHMIYTMTYDYVKSNIDRLVSLVEKSYNEAVETHSAGVETSNGPKQS